MPGNLPLHIASKHLLPSPSLRLISALNLRWWCKMPMGNDNVDVEDDDDDDGDEYDDDEDDDDDWMTIDICDG